MNNNECPICGKSKKPWFPLCWDCSEKENKKPRCSVCDIEVPEGHTLCKEHWTEKREEKRGLKQVEYVKKKKEQSFKEKFEGKFYFNSQKVKSKSELLICYFLAANNVTFQYEKSLNIDNKPYRPDFILTDGNFTIILEHFGLNTSNYLKKQENKIKVYNKFCKENSEFCFINTTEEDMLDLSEKLGDKLNTTFLSRPIWR